MTLVILRGYLQNMQQVPPKVAPSRGDQLEAMFRKLFSRFGPQGWWPARTRLEVILGAILVQNTNWRNAALAIQNLREAGLLDSQRLRRASLRQIEVLVRPAGFYRQKAKTIRGFLSWLDLRFSASLSSLFASNPLDLRAKLLKLNGLGRETVDAILLYAGKQPFFVADAYTRRVLVRHGMIEPGASYGRAQGILHENLPRDASLFNEFHALLVEVGKQYCRRNEPLCATCPLYEFLPEGGPAGIGSDSRRKRKRRPVAPGAQTPDRIS